MFINAKFLLQIIPMNRSKKRELFNGNLNLVLCQYHYDVYMFLQYVRRQSIFTCIPIRYRQFFLILTVIAISFYLHIFSFFNPF